MTWGQWIVGWVLLAVEVVAAAAAGRGLRRRLAPDLAGAIAGVATGVAAVTVVVLVSVALGSMGLFRVWALPPALVVVALLLEPGVRPWAAAKGGRDAADALVVAAAARSASGGRAAGGGPAGDEPVGGGATGAGPLAPPDDPASGAHDHEPAVLRWVAWAIVAMAAASWLDRVVAVYRRGTTDGDSMMYHLVFAARAVQHGWTTGTAPVGPDAWVAFYPANVEMLDAAVMLPFRSDVAVPLVNLGWLALALAAGWAVGAAVGRAAVGLAVVGVVTSLPLVVATQGGTARVDIATIALVVAAVALLVARPVTVGTAALGGMALGLAIGAKFALLPLAGVLLVLVAVALWRRRGWRPSAAWLGAATAAGVYWYVRNWWVTGSPAPVVDLRIGPVGFAPLSDDRLSLLDDSALAAHVGEPGFWGNIAGPVTSFFTGSTGLTAAVLALALVSVVLVARLRPVDLRHAVVVAGVVGLAAYPFSPYGAPLRGTSTSNPMATVIVGLNTRYVVPALAVLLCMLPVGLSGLPGRAGRWAGVAVVGGSAGAVAFLWRKSLSFDAEWPTSTGDAIAAAVVVAAIGAVALAVALAGRWPAAVAAAAALGVMGYGVVLSTAVVGDGDDGLHSYRSNPADLVTLWRATDALAPERVALIGEWIQYPHMGARLETEVDYLGLPDDRGLERVPTDCDEIEAALALGDHDVVVVQPSIFVDHGGSAAAISCLEGLDGARRVTETPHGAVFVLGDAA